MTLALEGEVGRGATAVVWRATMDGESVALKVAHTPDGGDALAAEAIHAALALSPRLPELCGLGRLALRGSTAVVGDSGLPFIALRWRSGRSLAEQPETGALLALRVARDVGEALADLHGVGLSHGDIKPANIALGDDGRAALLDLGLAGPAHRIDIGGATPRYLARGDRHLGDARARDLLALGLVIAELASPEVARADEPVTAARAAALPAEVASLCAALLAPEPGARPSARWVRDAAARAAGLADALAGDSAERAARRVRAAYLRLRRREIAGAASLRGEVAPWLGDSVETHRRARALCKSPGEARAVLEALGTDGRRRWLCALSGSAAAAWPTAPYAGATETEMAARLTRLARETPPELWVLADVDRAFRDEPGARPHAPARARTLDAEGAAELALALRAVPPDWRAIEAVEELGARAPEPLLLAAADALRLAGELGRARALVLGRTRGAPLVADVLRRAGDAEAAAAVASLALDADDDGRARACLARIRLDEGAAVEAGRIAEAAPLTAATAEVAALASMARGEVARAHGLAERALALASSSEARARASATIAYVIGSSDPRGACDGYRLAAAHAVQAGAVLEEASYRTGEAAAAVDLGEIAAGVEAATRAALLWEQVLERPAMSARAWLARAAAYAAIDARHEALDAAAHAIAQAEECGDARAQIYARWSIADVHDAGSAEGAAAARAAADGLDGEGEDDLQAAARLWRHAPEAIDQRRRDALDARCRHAAHPPASAFARLAWWGARAEALVTREPEAERTRHGRQLLLELAALAQSDAPRATFGRAMHHAARLAAALGDSDAHSRFAAAQREAARSVIAGAGRDLAEAAAACPWLAAATAGRPAEPQAELPDLRQLVRALSERDDLKRLLDRVVDVLILWTGAERGLLLLKNRSGELRPKSGRNLAAGDLGAEQLAVSTSLAERAMQSREPVVAIDAMEELSRSYESVHALKLRSVLVLPLYAHGEVLGVAYLDDRLRCGAFGERELSAANAVAPIAALAIADARAQADLKRALRRAERASHELAENLARKETALDVAERELSRTLTGEPARLHHENIIGQSEAMRSLLRLCDRVASSDVPVLLRGESGSGKEVLARAIHRGSARGARAFVGENCGALPETLLESALFGHVKGAFTGADRPRVGLFEAADEGTLFLDEIGEMSLGMQTKLLRVLEDSLVRPVGSTRSRKVDVRILAATHRDLEKMVAAGTFREDLYYRLNVISVVVPPLRERAADIPLLVEHLLRKHAAGRRITVTRAALSRLGRAPWPGNVRQLENEIRRALLLADDVIDTPHLSISEGGDPSEHELGLNVRARIDHLETRLVGEAMERTAHNQTKAAKLLGVSRYGLHKMMKRLGLPAKP